MFAGPLKTSQGNSECTSKSPCKSQVTYIPKQESACFSTLHSTQMSVKSTHEVQLWLWGTVADGVAGGGVCARARTRICIRHCLGGETIGLTKKRNVNNTGHSEDMKSDACLFGLIVLKAIKHALSISILLLLFLKFSIIYLLKKNTYIKIYSSTSQSYV